MLSDRPAGYRIGDIEIDLLRRRVLRNQQEIKLGRLSFDLLVAMARSAPEVLSREALTEQVWRGRFASQQTVKQRVTLLRQALGDKAADPRYIRVVRGHGYALIPDVEVIRKQAVSRPLRVALWGTAGGGGDSAGRLDHSEHLGPEVRIRHQAWQYSPSKI